MRLAGLALAALFGALQGLLVATVTVRYRADNMVTGIAANILAVGLTSFLVRTLLGHGAAPRIHLDLLTAWQIPGLGDIPGIGPLLFDQPLLTYAALLAALPLTLFLDNTRWGLDAAGHRRESLRPSSPSAAARSRSANGP